MRKLLVTLIVGLLSFTFFIGSAWAHSGGTDSNGGHHCWTNCAKWGYETGEYHYHNTNKSTPSNSGATTSPKTSSPAATPAPKTTPKPAPKPAYTQADVDSGRESGKSLGYEDGYVRKSKNTTATTGNEGYKKGYAAGYEAGYNDGLRKIKEEDTVAGTTSGEEVGKASYRDGKEKEVAPTSDQSDDWNTAYKAAFIKTYDYEKIVHSAEQSGHDLGYSLDKMEVPTDLAKDKALKNAFETHYKKGNEERVKEENTNHLALGNKDGYALSLMAIDSLDDRFVDSYKQGYEEGKLKLKEEILDEGHQSAYINMKYEAPGSYEQKELKDWHKEGYESNDIAVEIKEKAFEEGRTNSDYVIPERFEVNAESTALYDSLFEEGQEKRAEEKRKNMMYTVGIGIPAAGAAIGGFFLMKRKKKKVV